MNRPPDPEHEHREALLAVLHCHVGLTTMVSVKPDVHALFFGNFTDGDAAQLNLFVGHDDETCVEVADILINRLRELRDRIKRKQMTLRVISNPDGPTSRGDE